jgi:membrane protein implicated in regulation of membrane protease activity
MYSIFNNIEAVELWLVLGAVCLIIELQVSGIGFLFLGLGSLSNAALIYTYPNLSQYQYSFFGLLSFLWFIILWWPLRRYMQAKSKNTQHYMDMVGSEVEIYNSSLLPGDLGQVKWSGTVMNARLDEMEQNSAAIGDKLFITAIHGNILICSKIKKHKSDGD